MSDDLYSKSDRLFILTGDDFTTKGGQTYLKSNAFRGQGLIKAYAPWCGHCQSKVEAMKELGKIINGGREYDVRVYVYNADDEPDLINGDRTLVEGFPTMLFVEKDRSVDNIFSPDGKTVHDLETAFQVICDTHQAACGVY